MIKKLLVAFLFAVSISTSVSAKVAPGNVQREYVWLLHNDGCFYLYRHEVIVASNDNDVALEWWTPMNYKNYIGTTVQCVYDGEQMDNMT